MPWFAPPRISRAAAVDAARARLRAAGVEEVESSHESGYVSCKVADPDGYVVELAYDADHGQLARSFTTRGDPASAER